jgi:hypothetical protein
MTTTKMKIDGPIFYKNNAFLTLFLWFHMDPNIINSVIIVTVNINRMMNLINTPSGPFYKEQFGKNFFGLFYKKTLLNLVLK